MTATENFHAGAFIVSEANGFRSRESVTVLSGQTLKAGHVVGNVAHGTAAAVAFVGNTGTGTMGAITVGAGAKVGAYKLLIVEPAANAGAFELEDPDGIMVGITGDVATLFTGGGLSFTLADATDFASGDGFTITVAAGTGKYKEFNPANTDGSEVPVGILFDAVDASAADKAGVALLRDFELSTGALTWFSGATSDDKAAAFVILKTHGIIART